jgi:serine protease inhibitor
MYLLTACSDHHADSSSDIDTRPTLSRFLETKTEAPSTFFDAEQTLDSVESANRTAFSFIQYQLHYNDSNIVITPWPLFSSLALVTSASHGETEEEVTFELAEFDLETSWSLAYQALINSQAALIDSGLLTIEHDIWSQYNSLFEPAFLNTIDATFHPRYESFDFSSNASIIASEAHQATFDYLAHFALQLNIKDYTNTRLLSFNKLKLAADFEATQLQITAFQGLFKNADNEYIRTPMLSVHGTLDYYENAELIAQRIPLADNNLSLISIQAKDSTHDFADVDLNTLLSDINSAWIQQESTANLPVFTVQYALYGNLLGSWKGIYLPYSEALADLRRMDRKGGLYLQDLPWANSFSINEQGLELGSISGHAISFSPRNSFAPGGGQYGSWFENIQFRFCNMILSPPDLTTGLLLVQNTGNGLIQSVVSLKQLQGTLEAQANCTKTGDFNGWSASPE